MSLWKLLGCCYGRAQLALLNRRDCDKLRLSPPVFSASCLCPCPTSVLHLQYSSLNLQYDVGEGLRLSHKSGAIVSSPPTRGGLCYLVSWSQLCGHSGSGFAAPLVPGRSPVSNRR